MYTSEKTDRVIWQATYTTGVPILGRTQAKLMNYISYPKIHPPQEQSPVSKDSLKSADYIHSLKTTNHSLQSTKTAQSTDSLKTTPITDQTAQEEHRVTTKAKTSTAHEPKSAQVSWCKSSITINGKTHPLPTTKEYILHEYADVFKGDGTYLNSQNPSEDYASLESNGHGNLDSRMHLKPLNRSSQHSQS